jgi:dinuclear metal center YbgI/SA1388 family protein
MKIADIINQLESFAPSAYQEDWDNTGLQVGAADQECTGVLLCVDVTPDIVDEAHRRGANLIVSHHPLIFKGLKHLTGATQVERAVIGAITRAIAIYSCHTSVDNAPDGVSFAMARLLGLTPDRALSPRHGLFQKLVVMVPNDHAERVRQAMFDAGAGHIGEYSCCSYNVTGTGTFRAGDNAHPFVGEIGQIHHEPETSIQVIVPKWLSGRVVSAMLNAHPYEVPAYDIFDLKVDNPDIGLGVVAHYDTPITLTEFIARVKHSFHSPVVRTTHPLAPDTKISRVAMCGGAGGEFIHDAIRSGAQIYLSSDTRYHDFVDHSSRIMLVDIGHYESEQCTKDIFYHVITQKFPNFAVYKSELEKNPINYL